MDRLKQVPKWVWVGGGIAAILAIILTYDRRSKEEEAFDPCDPETFDPELCPFPEDKSQYPAKQMAVPSGAAGGINYYLPLGYGEQKSAPAQGAEDGLPTEPSETPVEPNPVGEVVGPFPGSPVPGSTPEEGLYGAVPAPGGGLVTAPPVPAPSPGAIAPARPAPAPIGVAPAVPAPGGWCGHARAVGVGRPCADKAKVSPPPGWHWFCCNGMLGRAPN